MQDVPKIVVKRLQSPAAGSHPDADLLTAFAEHSLVGPERDNVVEHLARCGDCREVVALALPATEAIAVGRSGSAARTGWFSWPVLRWGVVAAGIAAVASVGILQFRQRSQEKLASTSLMARNQVADTVAESPSPSLPTSASQPVPAGMGKPTEMRKRAAVPAQGVPAGDKLARSANAVSPQSQLMHGGNSGGIGGTSAGTTFGGPIQRSVAPRPDLAFQTGPQNPAPAVPAKQNGISLSTNETVVVSGASQAVEVSGDAPLIATETASQNQLHGQLIQHDAAEQAQPLNGRQEAVVRSKPTSPASPVGMVPTPELRADSSLMKNAVTPRWTISSSGALQRSLDGGKTWLDVNIAVDTSMSLNLVGRSQSEPLMSESRSQTKTVTGAEPKIEKKTETKNDLDAKARYKTSSAAKSVDSAAPAVTPTIFRALSVSSNAAEVWAGGIGGALYHTMDGGNLWVRVLPAAAGIVLTGDIVSIQFPDPRNGTVTTSNAEVWATNDDGQTWRKQQ